LLVLVVAARCLDQYFVLRVKEVEQKEQVDVDPRLVAVVERMMDRYVTDDKHQQQQQEHDGKAYTVTT
jgi:26S proteasome regulatory subunit N2